MPLKEVRIHKGCGGHIKQGRCKKCGQPFSKLSLFLGKGIEYKLEEFSSDDHRRRIREGRDLR